jgi:hypothetical protein
VAAVLLYGNKEAERGILCASEVGDCSELRIRHSACDPLYFPLVFRLGELRWHLAVRYQGDAQATTTTTTTTEFHVVSLPHIDSISRPVVAQYCIALR